MGSRNAGQNHDLQRTLDEQVRSGQMADRRERDSLYMEAAAPLLKVGRLANEFSAAGQLRAGESPALLAAGGGDTHSEMLAQKRDTEAMGRMPRSSSAWAQEQQRPGSWQSGVGNITPVGMGRQTAIGQGRPVFKQGE